MIKRLIITYLLLFAGISALAQETPDLQSFQFQEYDWGMVIVETTESNSFITIDSPVAYTAVDNAFTISGTGQALFENNVIIEITDVSGNLLLQGVTTMVSEEVGGAGEWSLDLTIDNLDEATAITIVAYSTSPRDGSVIAQDSIQLNANAQFGLPYVEITSPRAFQAIESSFTVEGTAGAIFENNIVVEVWDANQETILAETFATIETDELAGSGDWSTEIDLSLDAGTSVVIRAYEPAIEDDAPITVEAIAPVIVNPRVSYDLLLKLYSDDPLIQNGIVDCERALAEFDDQETLSILVEDVVTTDVDDAPYDTQVEIQAADSSVCPLPIRVRFVRNGNSFTGDLYRDVSGEPTACTADLQPFSVYVPIGITDDVDYSFTVNGID
ncbi:MAG: Gmad2 immunoglobulin-like domain-containing protein [Chloroflexota bacterium]